MKKVEKQLRLAMAGNPNVGKSTLFNAMTGLHQHTGNWPGKTVGAAVGRFLWEGWRVECTDLPGTYSLSGSSQDERIAGEAISRGDYDCIIAVCDGSCLERSLILVLQILAQRGNVVVCVNLMDEAEGMGLTVDGAVLARELGVPVVLTHAGDRNGMEHLLHHAQLVAEGQTPPPRTVDDPVQQAQTIAARCVSAAPPTPLTLRREWWDRLLVSRYFGIPILVLVLLAIVCITVWGANIPSALLARCFDWGYGMLIDVCEGLPGWLSGLLVDGVYATTARVISVMLPPMAIFFPLFTLLEDVGYLPRMAFLLDHGMRRCGGCGKQALTLCMGLGCNAVGVTGCRILESPRQRLLGILTNAMIPCNGRFPTLMVLGSLLLPQAGAAVLVAASIALGLFGVMASCFVLSRTALKGEQSFFLMELPPFRKPRVGQILVRSLIDRTAKIALRALKMAAPAGAILYLLTSGSLMEPIVGFLQPVGKFFGLNGVILLAFFLSFPANELLLPVVLLGLSAAGTLHQAVALDAAQLSQAGWSSCTVLCTMVLTLFHWPCATTMATIYKETGSFRQTLAAFLLPTGLGLTLCLLIRLCC